MYDADGTTVVASSKTAGDGDFESFRFRNPYGFAWTYHLGVCRRSGPSNTFIEIFTYNAGTWEEYADAGNSTTSPSNADGENVLSIGAVSVINYALPWNWPVIKDYSSRGPSNSGMTLPDLCGPTDTTGFTFPDGFTGTSCAMPNAAGAACAFWSADTRLTANAIAWLLKEQADLWRDWAPSGNDNTYGRGGIQLTDYIAGTRWAARAYPDILDDGTVPYETIQAAHDAVPSGGRLLIFGGGYGSFPEPAILGTSYKSMAVEPVSDSGTAVVGE